MSTSDKQPTVPWAKITYWNILFGGLYFFRSVSFDIWLASKKTEVEFGELKFGETNLRTVRKILEIVPLSCDSTLFELGCGRGRAAFLFHFLTGAKIVAIDLVGPFIVTARRLARWLGCDDSVLFCYENFLTSDLQDADVIYACALCLTQETRQKLAQRIETCSSGTYLVTVGWEPKTDWLLPLTSFSSRFSWGTANIYIAQVQHQPTIRP